MDHKFQCQNRWTFGSGIAFGLEVQQQGDEALTVSQGLAVDRQGRYLIVDEPAVCRIKTLKGFGEIPGETALLWLRYREELGQPMLVPREGGEADEYSVRTERFEFYLTQPSAEPLDTVDRMLYFDRELYADDCIRVRQIMPALLSSGSPVKIRLIFENLTGKIIESKLHYAPKLPGFHMEGREDIVLDKKKDIPEGQSVVELVLIPETSAQSVCFTLEPDDFTLELLDRVVGLSNRIEKALSVVAGDPVEELASGVLAMSPQEIWGEDDQGVPLAALRLIRYEEKVRLVNVTPLYQQQKAHLPALEQRLEVCSSFFPRTQELTVPVDVPEKHTPSRYFDPEWSRCMTTGVVSLNAGLHLRKGKVLCTGEITHNLGIGPVYMDFGIEQVLPASDEDRNIRNIVLGDASLFIPAEDDYEHNFDRAVRIHPEKGTFELALRLREELHEPTLLLRWYAWRPEGAAVEEEEESTLLRLEPSVVYAGPGEEIYFSPIFRGAGQSCEFFVEEKQSGLITRDGVYTAPESDGLYQIHAQVQNQPDTRVSAFIIVRSQEEGAEDDSTEI